MYARMHTSTTGETKMKKSELDRIIADARARVLKGENKSRVLDSVVENNSQWNPTFIRSYVKDYIWNLQ